MQSFFDNFKKAARNVGNHILNAYGAEQKIIEETAAARKRFDDLPDDVKKSISGEPVGKQFARFASRVLRYSAYEPIELQDINIIRMPETPGGKRVFAKRNAHGNWNVWQRTGHAQGPEPLCDHLLAMNVKVGEALNTLAAQNPDGMKTQTHMNWHPLRLAARIGHTFPDELGHKIPVPKDLLPPPAPKKPRPPQP